MNSTWKEFVVMARLCGSSVGAKPNVIVPGAVLDSEEEGSARELHDDFYQRLAVMAMDVGETIRGGELRGGHQPAISPVHGTGTDEYTI
jgi:hypothetical protein